MKPPRISRRRVLGAGAGLFAAGVLAEVGSLRGWFDNRRLASGEGAERFATSLAGADRGLVHLAHSTHVLCVGGLRLLTDPWFYDPAFGSLEHSVKPPVLPEHLGALDGILLSHDHPDHADFRALDRMQKSTPVVCATGDLARRAKAVGFTTTHVLAPWEQLRLGAVTLTATPAEHDAYEVGYVAQAPDFSVYFAGDTRLCPAIDAVAERFPALDLAVLPVDGTRVKTSQQWVMTPEDAVVATLKLRPRAVVPSHAEARFCDALVSSLLATDIPESARRYASLLATRLPQIACSVPAPGELIRVA